MSFLNPIIECECGCGNFRMMFDNQGHVRSFLKGHQNNGRLISQETGNKLSITKKGEKPNFVWTEEYRKKASKRMNGNKLHLGFKHSLETKKKMSESWDYNKHTTEITRDKRRKLMIGNKHTLGHSPSAESRLKMRHARLGKPLKPETVQKLRNIRATTIFPNKETKPEKIISELLSNEQIEFQKHKPIIGQPDIFIKPNICIFIDGCYWHFCQERICDRALNSKQANKIQIKNILNDLRVERELKRLGYNVIRIWEHEIKRGQLNMKIKELKMLMRYNGVKE